MNRPRGSFYSLHLNGLTFPLRHAVIFVLLAVVTVVSCREPFQPEISFANTHLLVVEGYINAGAGVTSIKLSRTASLEAPDEIVYEEGALVTIEDDDGNQFLLSEGTKGLYLSEELSLPTSAKYRIMIKTKQSKTYVSDFTQPVITPDIDSVTWKRHTHGLGIYVNTHDATNTAKYYKWDFEEAWELKSPYSSFLIYSNGLIVKRSETERILMERCWKTTSTKDLLIASTTNLTANVVNQFPLIFVPASSSDRFTYKYTVLVKQHALSREEYEYLQLIKKNTDEVGEFWDPMPSELYGNIRCQEAPDERVIGYVGSYTLSEKRIYIHSYQVKDWGYDLSCFEVDVMNTPDSLRKYFGQLGFIPTIGAYQFPDPVALRYSGAPAMCVDCRKRGGSTLKPDFWSD